MPPSLQPLSSPTTLSLLLPSTCSVLLVVDIEHVQCGQSQRIVPLAFHIDGFNVTDAATFTGQIQIQMTAVQFQCIDPCAAIGQLKLNIADLDRIITGPAMKHIRATMRSTALLPLSLSSPAVPIAVT